MLMYRIAPKLFLLCVVVAAQGALAGPKKTSIADELLEKIENVSHSRTEPFPKQTEAKKAAQDVFRKLTQAIREGKFTPNSEHSTLSLQEILYRTVYEWTSGEYFDPFAKEWTELALAMHEVHWSDASVNAKFGIRGKTTAPVSYIILLGIDYTYKIEAEIFTSHSPTGADLVHGLVDVSRFEDQAVAKAKAVILPKLIEAAASKIQGFQDLDERSELTLTKVSSLEPAEQRQLFKDRKIIDAYLRIANQRLYEVYQQPELIIRIGNQFDTDDERAVRMIEQRIHTSTEYARNFLFNPNFDLLTDETLSEVMPYLSAIAPVIAGASVSDLQDLMKKSLNPGVIVHSLPAFLERHDGDLSVFDAALSIALGSIGSDSRRTFFLNGILNLFHETINSRRLAKIARHLHLIQPLVRANQDTLRLHPKRGLPIEFLKAIVRESELEHTEIEAILLSYGKLMPKEMAEWLRCDEKGLPASISAYLELEAFAPPTLAQVKKLPVRIESIRPLLQTRDGALWTIENILTRKEWLSELAPLEFWIAAAPLNNEVKADELEEQLLKVRPELRLHPELLSHVWGKDLPAKPW